MAGVSRKAARDAWAGREGGATGILSGSHKRLPHDLSLGLGQVGRRLGINKHGKESVDQTITRSKISIPPYQSID